jgi:hypothetical protein
MRRWKKVLKQGNWVERLKQEKNNILEGCREAIRLHEGIYHIPESHNPLEVFKYIIDIVGAAPVFSPHTNLKKL